MPFTLSHVAAALPFRRSRLIFSAVGIGSIAPDIEYFVRLRPGSGWGHTIPGAFCLSLPLGLAVLWLYHRFAKLPILNLLPEQVQRRLGPLLTPFRFGPSRRFLLILVSMLAGIATHIAWDSFTHPNTWLSRHWSFLHRSIWLPIVGYARYSAILQDGSGFFGVAVLIVWFVYWYRSTKPGPLSLRSPFTAAHKAAIVVTMLSISTAGAMLRGFASVGFPLHGRRAEFAGEAVVTLGALIWWQLVVWGFLLRTRAVQPAPVPDHPTA